MPNVPPCDTSEALGDMFDSIVRNSTSTSTSLLMSIFYHYVSRTKYTQVVLILESTAHILQALALGGLIRHIGDDNSPASAGYLWASAIVGCSVYVMFAHHIYFFATWRLGMEYKNGAIASIYRKCLRLKSTHSAVGVVQNLATNDVERFFLSCIFLPYLLFGPIEALAVLAIGVNLIGSSFGIGYILLLLFVPLQYHLSQKFAKVRAKVAKITDRRVELISQAVGGSRLMKMSVWENSFEERIEAVRREEIQALASANLLKAYNEALFFVCNVVIAAVIFTSKTAWFKETLTASDVFTVITLVNIVQFTMTKFFSLGIMGVSEVAVTISRIEEFMKTSEVTNPRQLPPSSDDIAVELKDVTTYWDDDVNGTIAVSNASMTVKKGTIKMIIGPVGGGKSALVSAIIGDQHPFTGEVKVNGTLAYAPQQPFIVSATIKENVLFGKSLDESWYAEVIKAVALDVDLEALTEGDLTIVGDRGVNLSGGQKARIGVARALYAKPDVIVLDDIMSAVDVKVMRKIWEDCITKLLLNRLSSSVILVSHQHQFCRDPLVNTNNILVMDGQIKAEGTYKECIEQSDERLVGANAETSKKKMQKSKVIDVVDEEEPLLPPPPPTEGDVKDGEVGGMTTATEETAIGKISTATFKTYLRSMSNYGTYYPFFGVMLTMLGGQALLIWTMAELGKWAEKSPTEQRSASTLTNVWVLVAVTIVLSFVRSTHAFHRLLNAAFNLHSKMTQAVLSTKISFFDTRPLGLILNRFSADVGITDDQLVATIFDFLLCGLMTLGSVVTAAYALPIVLISVPFLAYYFVGLRRVYIKASREIKRIESTTRSPVYTALSESMLGLSTIRAFRGAHDFFSKEFQLRHNENLRAFFSWLACTRWLGFRLDAICLGLLMAACYLAVICRHHTSFNIEPAILGLAITFLIQLAGLFQWTVRQSAEAENMLISVERILEFAALDAEKNLDEMEGQVAPAEFGKDWPKEGSMTFENVKAKYRPSLDFALKGISFEIKGGEKVGVVGRTGSGKSTLLQVIMRLPDVVEGKMTVDDVDTELVPLRTFRKKFAVIPQTPTLFNVSLRDNLDPFSEYDDSAIWGALDIVQMKTTIVELGEGLNYMLSSGGSNFSVGQRQLLCLSRAILTKCKILIMDESAANVDPLTDLRLQEAVKNVFADSTVLSIAHRLDSVMEYDKVLVLGAGEVLEYGSPRDLLKKKDGAFYAMVQDSNLG